MAKVTRTKGKRRTFCSVSANVGRKGALVGGCPAIIIKAVCTQTVAPVSAVRSTEDLPHWWWCFWLMTATEALRSARYDTNELGGTAMLFY